MTMAAAHCLWNLYIWRNNIYFPELPVTEFYAAFLLKENFALFCM